jgi:hypothetical protein
MTAGEPIVVATAEQVHPLIEEARLARIQAEEAVQRIQHRIERLVSLCEALDRPRSDDDGREPRLREGELAPALRPSD